MYEGRDDLTELEQTLYNNYFFSKSRCETEIGSYRDKIISLKDKIIKQQEIIRDNS